MQETGVFSQKSEQKSAQEQMMTNPDMMSGMMKQNLVGIIPQASALSTPLTYPSTTDFFLTAMLSTMSCNCAGYMSVLWCAAQIAMGTFVSYFFSGFILGKIPFPLSPSFRLMLQVKTPHTPLPQTSGQIYLPKLSILLCCPLLSDLGSGCACSVGWICPPWT